MMTKQTHNHRLPKRWVIAKAITKLPLRWQYAIGRVLGTLLRHILKRRRKIAQINIALCFPDLTQNEQKQLLKKNFHSLGISAIEMSLAWFASNTKFSQVALTIKGKENLIKASENNRGVILCCGHFTCLEIIGRCFGERYPLYLSYQKHKDPQTEAIIHKARSRYTLGQYKRQDIRAIIKTLRAGGHLFYAPDQDFGNERCVFAEFMGVPAASLTATARLTQMGRAACIPTLYYRTGPGQYVIEFLPHFDPYPTEDPLADARAYNAMLEQYVRQYPDQYLWQHRRFKTRPEGEARFY